jgi:hypothetical protein
VGRERQGTSARDRVIVPMLCCTNGNHAVRSQLNLF